MSELLPQRFENGLTVRELKALIKDWPETNHYTGEEREVWIGAKDGSSNQCFEIWPLNIREDDNGNESADMLLDPSND